MANRVAPREEDMLAYPPSLSTTPLLNRQTSDQSVASSSYIGPSSAWYTIPRNKALALAIEETFQVMQYRKLVRRLSGTYENDKPWITFWTFLILLLVTTGTSKLWKNIYDNGFSTIGFWSFIVAVIVVILVYTLTRVMVVVRWALYWLLFAEVLLYFLSGGYNIFAPKDWKGELVLVGFIVFEVLTFVVYGVVHFVYPRVVKSRWFRQTIGPKYWYGVQPVLSGSISNHSLTFTYGSSFCAQRHTCTYRGMVDEYGLPHGNGYWMDDSTHGEILSGMWDHGKPVGPFQSREYGSGFAFRNVRVAYLHFSDDTFTSRRWIPSWKEPPKIGVAGVECSVSGQFFSDLPRVEVLYGPFLLGAPAQDDEEPRGVSMTPGRLPINHSTFNHQHVEVDDMLKTSVKACLRRMPHLSSEHPSANLSISADSARGVTISGHTPLPHTSQNPIVIDVVNPLTPIPESRSPIRRPSGLGMAQQPGIQGFTGAGSEPLPIESHNVVRAAQLGADESASVASGLAFGLPGSMKRESMILADNQGSDTSGGGGHVPYSPMMGSAATVRDVPPPAREPDARNRTAAMYYRYGATQQGISDNQFITTSFNNNALLDNDSDSGDSAGEYPHGTTSYHFNQQSLQQQLPHLNVRNWKSSVEGHAEALVFFPGFNASTEHSLKRLGQFMAMGHFPPHIKPFLFRYPCGRELTYMWALESAQCDQVLQALEDLLQGIQDAGIEDIHFLAHSMGVMTLMAAFENPHFRGQSARRSRISKLFKLMVPSDHHGAGLAVDGDATAGSSNQHQDSHAIGEAHLLKARTITLLNPDYPMDWFVNSSFIELRRVCNQITVIGDRKDGALFWSELGNGIINTMYNSRFMPKCFYQPHYIKGARYRNFMQQQQGEPERPSPTDEDGGCCICCCWSPMRKNMGAFYEKELAVGKNMFRFYRQDPLVEAAPGNEGPGNGEGIMARTRNNNNNGKRYWLDLDAIDTTWMDQNVHALRHNYFNLNPVIIEDLHELIVTGKRASERSLLLHREGNIFTYTSTPACVLND